MGRKLQRVRRITRVGGPALVVWAVATELRKPPSERTWTGTLAGFVPYDFRRPSLSRMRRSMWAPDDDRFFVPQVFGVGWTVNLAKVAAAVRR